MLLFPNMKIQRWRRERSVLVLGSGQNQSVSVSMGGSGIKDFNDLKKKVIGLFVFVQTRRLSHKQSITNNNKQDFEETEWEETPLVS